ncbi:ATP-grasp superfamily enzyme [Saccharomonospora marina XMU15]|uniref:ATP-grasp superfamily enzyme n=1 Tax=Saccharomonospora marina XMU15 TaxID=882083 RepID=H5WWP6_9PSEU|nr:PAC2 family protein [Saccharomonospora marina]EHR51659.1 ATP-grasp superfamily enzyme [Saccharomonospora marina XMU15]
MGADPERLYEMDSDVPELTGSVLLYHLDGFIDAGSAGSVLADHLCDELPGRVVARFDTDRLVDYRSRRPPMTYSVDRWTEYRAPELTVRLAHDLDGNPLLLLRGPEPDHEWERFADAVGSLVERWGVRLGVNYHGIPMGVPHTRPLGVTAHGTRDELLTGHRSTFGQVRIPGSAAALVELRLGQRGHDVLGFAAHVPHYLAQTRYPAAAVTLLDAVTSATGLRLPGEALREAAARVDAEVARQVADSAEAADVVAALERQYDAFAAASAEGGNLLADETDMPTGEELASQFERFLAEQQRGDEQGDS